MILQAHSRITYRGQGRTHSQKCQKLDLFLHLEVLVALLQEAHFPKGITEIISVQNNSNYHINSCEHELLKHNHLSLSKSNLSRESSEILKTTVSLRLM